MTIIDACDDEIEVPYFIMFLVLLILLYCWNEYGLRFGARSIAVSKMIAC